jgi:hypothetical protein
LTARVLNGAEAPFADAFMPAVVAAGTAVTSACPGTVVDGAVSSLFRGMANELGSLAAPTLLHEFSRMPGRTSLRSDRQDDVTAFGRWLDAGGLAAVLAQRPDLDDVLQRHLATAILRLRELLARLEANASLLEQALGFRLPAVDATPLVNGACVLTDAEGCRVVYKRRPLEMEVALEALLRHVNERGWGPPLAAARAVDLGGHGFMEHVLARPVSSAAELHLACECFGMVLAVATLLGSADLHARNVIVGADGPVIVDAETMLRPPWSERDDREASVHASAILPMRHFVHGAGLLAAFPKPAASQWRDVGTDAVRTRPVTPTLATARREAEEHLRRFGPDGAHRVLAGFRSAYAGIVADGLPVEMFAGTAPRVLLRPSSVYEDVMLSSLSPDVVAVRGRRATLVESALATPPQPVEHVEVLADAVRRAEVDHVDRFVFPRFTMPAVGGDLRIDDRNLAHAPFEAPLVRAHRLVATATRTTLERHAAEVEQQLAEFMDVCGRSSPVGLSS